MAGAFGELGMVFIRNQRAVHIDRHFPAECVVNAVVLRRRGEVLISAHDMGDAHQMVVHHICKIVGRVTVGFDQDHVVELGIIHGNVPVYLIVERRGSFRRHVETNDIRLP